MGIRDTVIAFGTVSGPNSGPAGDAAPAFGLRLEAVLATRPESTFYVRAEGEDWADSGLRAGDILVIDRSAAVTPGAVVLAVIGGELLVRRVESDPAGHPVLRRLKKTGPAGDTPATELTVWGVVTWTIRKVGA